VRLRTNIFLWVSLATVVPLTAIVLLVTGYSERLHRADADERLQANLSFVVAEFDRRLSFEREVITALARSPSVERILPVLEAVRDGRRHPEHHERLRDLASFLGEIQLILKDVGTIRLLEHRANTLLKVRDGVEIPPSFTGLDPFPFADEEMNDPEFLYFLQTMDPGEVNYLLQPPSLTDYGTAGRVPMLDAVVPLADDIEPLPMGYLTVNSTGVQIDRILELSPRLYNGHLLIAELNPEVPQRDGMVLYDESAGHLFSTAKTAADNLHTRFGGRLMSAVRNTPYGAFDAPDGRSRVHYAEYYPYPNQLTSWVIATRVDTAAITAPFNRIRSGILLFAVVAILASLLLAQLGARRIALPITQLTQQLRDYAGGQRRRSVPMRSTQEINELLDAFDYMVDTLEQARSERDQAESMLLQSTKLASIGEMAAGIGHEINNPLHNILTLAKLIERSLPADDQATREDLTALTNEAHRASRIVRGILNFARQVPPHYEHTSVQALVEHSLQLVSQAARNQGVRLSTQIAPDLVIECDPHQLQQVLINLLLNAIQASSSGDAVRVEAGLDEDGRVRICVCDQGTGVKPEIMDKLFDPFFTTKPVGKGSGLGLSVSLGIIEHHGGTIRLANNEQGGLTVSIVLPLTPHQPGESSD
jgi:two-component system NtrC family sensor kinase